MKHMKKLASLLLALVMVFAMAVTVNADGETGSITINDAVVGQTYTVYQILDLESYNTESKAYSYKVTEAWSNFINGTGIKGVYVNVDDQGYVTWVKDANVAAFAKLAQAHAKTLSSNQGTTTASTTTVSFTGLDLGYYLVDTTLGTLCSLDTTNPNVTMEEKNEAPTNVKTVEEDSTGIYGEKNDADIGQTVKFKTKIEIPVGSENIVLHDKMSAGLTLDTTSIKVYTDENLTTELAAGNYNVTAPGASNCPVYGTECDFEVALTQTYLDSLTTKTTLYVGYSATLNENAVVAGEGNPNENILRYGDETKPTNTPPSTTKTYTWDVDVFKYTNDKDNKEVPLSGAVFTLSKNSDGSSPIALISEGNNVYRVAKTGETGTVTEITTDKTGKFTIKGLDSDTYYLTETKAPAGYNKLSGPVTITISDTGVVNGTTDAPQGVDEVKVLNQSGTELPSTGGIGTTIFYVLGSILVLGAAVLLVTKKRMSTN